MLDPRIYRAGLVAVALAVIVLAFSVQDQQAPLTTSLAPDAFNGQNAYTLTGKLAADYPDRRPGSNGDDALAVHVSQTFTRYGFAVSTSTFTARTALGTRPLETVIGTRAGLGGGAILIVAHRDAMGTPATSQASGTATLLELARVLSGETQHRTIMLASTSGSAGAAGATRLAKQLGGVDAVIALGDLATARLHTPVVVPFSDGLDLAPTVFRNTVGSALGTQAGIGAGSTSLGGQLAHLAFPLTPSEQGPFGARGMPAVLISAAGERGDNGAGALSQDRITGLGRATLQTINALDSAPKVPSAKPYLLLSGKLVPAWAIRLLVLSLIAPVLAVTVDGLARARRRGYSLLRPTLWTIGCAIPFLLAFGAIVFARLTGWIAGAPPGPLGAGDIPIHTSGALLLITLAALLVLSALALAPVRRMIKRADGDRQEDDAGKGIVVLSFTCAVTIAIWVINPFAALLVIPALHLWTWVLDREIGLYPPLAVALLLGGLVAPVLVILFYALTLGLGPVEVAWNWVLMIAGGHVGPFAATLWCLLLGCTAAACTLVARGAQASESEEPQVTIRGPVTYAGPGSLGGTESALRR